MAGVTSTLIGGGLGLLGAKKSADAQKDAARMAAEAAQFRPFNIHGGGLGGVTFDGQNVRLRQSPMAERMQRGFERTARDAFRGSPGQAGLMEAMRQAGGQFGSLFQGAQNDIGLGTSILGGATDQFGNQLGALQGQLPGLMSQFRSDALAPGVTDPSAMFALQQGAGLLQGDTSSVVQNTLDQLRAQARPQEERAVNSRVQELFSKGILSNTSGARALGELGLAQEQADIGRQLAAEQAGLTRFNAQQQAGQGLFGLGQSGLLQGRQLNQSFAGLGADVGFTGIGQSADLAQGLFDARGMFANAIQNRGANRLNMAQGLFGFGQDIRTSNINNALTAQQGFSANQADMRNLIALGGNLGSQGASAGANAGQFAMQGAGSGVGGFLTGAGTAFMNQGFNNMFAPKPSPELTGIDMSTLRTKI